MFELSNSITKKKILFSRKDCLLLAGIFLAALSIRLVFFFQLKSTLLYGFFSLDSGHYHNFALRILEGNFSFKESAYLNPLYPIIIAGSYKIWGISPDSIIITQIFADSLTCIFLYLIGLTAFGSNIVGFLASVIYAFYSMAIFYSGFILGATFTCFFLSLFVLLVYLAENRNDTKLWFFSGLILGLVVMLRPNLILLIPFLFIGIYFLAPKDKFKRISEMLFVLLGLLLILLPFSLRNYHIEKRFSPLPVQGGLNFYIGNHQDAKGVYTFLDGISNAPVKQIKQSVIKARKESGRELTNSEASRFWLLKGLRFIKNHPKEYIFLMIKKMFLFWNKIEVGENVDFSFYKQFLPLFSLPLFSFVLVFPLAMAGVVCALWERKKKSWLLILMIFGCMFSVIFFFVTSRYRFPCVVFLILMASYSLTRLFALARFFDIRKAFFILLVFSASFLIANKHISDIKSQDLFFSSYNNLGIAYYKKGQLDQALRTFKKALQINAKYPSIYYNLGLVYQKQGRLQEAIVAFLRAIKLGPSHYKARSSLGLIYYSQGKYRQALSQFKKAAEINHESHNTYKNIMAVIYYHLGDNSRALELLEKVVENAPDNIRAHVNLSRIYLDLGKPDQALRYYRQAQELGFSDSNFYQVIKNYQSRSKHSSR